MPITNFPNGISSFGMPVIGAGPVVTTGNVWFVYSSAQTAGGDGTTPTTAFTTLAAANSAATASNGDTVFVMAGHAETYTSATSITLSKAGVTYIGLGSGANRPTFTFTTAAGATVNVTGANISLFNLLFIANFADIAGAITTGAAKNLTVDSCEFRDTDATHNFLATVKTSTTDAAADGLSISGCKQISAGLTANTAFVDLRANIDRLTLGGWSGGPIAGNWVQSLVAGNSGLIYQATTTKVITTADISWNTLNFVGANAATGALLITTATTHTGVIQRNFVIGARAAASAIMVTASSGFKFFENYYQTAADKSGILIPANV